MKAKRWKPLCGESSTESQRNEGNLCFLYLLVFVCSWQPPAMPSVFTAQCSTLPAVTLCPSKQLLSQSAGVEASAGEGRTLSCLSLALLGRIQLGRGALPTCPWRCGRDKWDQGGEEEGVQVADTCPGWSQAGHMSCCPGSQGSQESRW